MLRRTKKKNKSILKSPTIGAQGKKIIPFNDSSYQKARRQLQSVDERDEESTAGIVIRDVSTNQEVYHRILVGAEDARENVPMGEDESRDRTKNTTSPDRVTVVSDRLSDHVYQVKHEKACEFLRRGEYEKALDEFEQIKKQLIKDGNHPSRVATAFHNKGIVHLRAGNLRRAYNALHEAVRIRKIALGERHPLVADSLEELGIIQLSQRKYEDSLETFSEALELRDIEKAALYSDADTRASDMKIAKTLNNVGCVYFEYKDFEEALRMYEEALEIQRKALSGIDPTSEKKLAMASTLCNIGYILSESERHQEACYIFKEACEVLQAMLDPSNKLVLNTTENLAYAYVNLGKLDDALELYEEIHTCEKETLGPNDIACAGTLKSMVRILVEKCDYEKARDKVLVIERIQEYNLSPESTALEKTRDILSLLNYQILKFSGPSDWFYDYLCCTFCAGKKKIEDNTALKKKVYRVRKPQNSSKMSGQKVSIA